MNGLGVPFARTEEGELADPATAQRSDRFLCLDCDEPVMLKRGEIRAPHFSHYPGTSCDGETVEHIAAKLKLQARLQRLQGTGEALKLFKKCDGYFEGSRASKCPRQNVVPLEISLGGFHEVVTEYPHQTFRIDVATLKEQRLITAFEIFVSHRVPSEKRDAIDVDIYEIEARSVLYSDTWELIGSVATRCDLCKKSFLTHQEAHKKYLAQVEKDRERQLEQERERQRIYRFVRDYYRKHIGSLDLIRRTAFLFEGLATRCMRCQRAVIVLIINNRTRFYEAASQLTQTRLVKLTEIEGKSRTFFVNTCPYCDRFLPQPKYEVSFSDFYWLGHGAIASAFGFYDPAEYRYVS